MADTTPALVVVACVVGIGAWGAKVTVSPNVTYASELFGPGHASPVYPPDIDAAMTGNQSGVPMVTLFIPANVTADPDANPPVAGVDHSGSAEVTFTVIGGTFNENITALMWDTNASTDDTTAAVVAPGTVASILEGGTKGDNSIKIKIESAADNGRGTDTPETISFAMPRLVSVALAGAHPKDPVKRVLLSASSRIVSGAFADGPLAGGFPYYVATVIRARDSLTLGIEASGDGMKTIAISDDAAKGLMAFKSVKEKNKAGYVELATVTITTRQLESAAKAQVDAKHMYNITGTDSTDPTSRVFSLASSGADAMYYDLYDLDGEMIDEGLRGSFSVSAMGTRDLFNEDDMLFVDYDGNGKMGAGENIAIDGDMAMGGSLSIDPDRSESFDKGGTGNFKVYYMPGGKMNINHGSMINLTAMVDYSDPSAIDEADAKSSTTLNFDGVGNPVRAYAIPHSTNGTGDKGNVRVRCENSTGCRVFLECWDDMGNRGFGEAPAIAGNNLSKWTSADIESVTGMEPSTRHSCRILSKGMVTVQQLTRDGNSGTLVNNTYVGGEE